MVSSEPLRCSLLPLWKIGMQSWIRQPVLLIRICISSPDLFLSVLGSVSYSNEFNKINWKGKFNKVMRLIVRSLQTSLQGKSSRCIKSTTLGKWPLWNSKDPDQYRYQIVGSRSKYKVGFGSVSKWKAGSGSVSKWSGSATMPATLKIFFELERQSRLDNPSGFAVQFWVGVQQRFQPHPRNIR